MSHHHHTQDTSAQGDIYGTKIAIYTWKAVQEKTPQPMQPVDLITFAGQLGFSDEQMIVFEDTSVPGDSSTDERDGLSRLMDAITQGTIQTVLVANERRLFRHRDAVDVNAFLRLCAEYDVAVITPQIIYDFSNPFMMQLFRFQCQEAATMLAQRVRFRLSTGMKTENHNR